MVFGAPGTMLTRNSRKGGRQLDARTGQSCSSYRVLGEADDGVTKYLGMPSLVDIDWSFGLALLIASLFVSRLSLVKGLALKVLSA
jgi:hypothetical protein